ncbi:MAG: transcriptional regulator [Inquilinus sp.]|nr:transcriptional regulator [Inquilinus sp.]
MPSQAVMKPTAVPTRRAVLDTLKCEGRAEVRALADAIGVSGVAVRQHLLALEAEGLVAAEDEARPKGRPVKLYRLTEAAARYFPDAHAELTVGLLGSMRQAFGEAGLNRLLSVRGREQADEYLTRMAGATDLRARLDSLAAIRTEEGYMAEIREAPGGGFLLIENHCPICRAAAACSGLCEAELQVFRRALGDRVRVERTDHILAGARRCAYRVTE